MCEPLKRLPPGLYQVHTDPDMAVELFMLEPSDQRAVAEHEEEFPPTVREG